MKLIQRFTLLFVALLALASADVAWAQALTWDSNGSTTGAQPGSGTWSTGTATWWNGTSNVVWTNGSDANFSSPSPGGNLTVSVVGGVTVNNLSVNTGPYTWSAGTSGSLTITGTISNSSGWAPVFNVPIVGNSVINAANSIALGGNNTYTGLTTATTANITVTRDNALGTTDAGTVIGVNSSSANSLILSGAFNYTTAEPLTIYGIGVSGGGALRKESGSGSFAGPITLGNSGVRIQTVNATLFTLSGAIGEAASGYSLNIGASSGTVALTGNNTFSGDVSIGSGNNPGILAISSDANLGAVPAAFSAGNITLNELSYLGAMGTGSRLRVTADVSLNANRGITFTNDRSAFDVVSGATFTVNGQLTRSGAGGFTKFGAGTMVLVADAPVTQLMGPVVVSEGTLQVGNGGSTGFVTSGTITTNATLAYNRNNAFTVANTIIGSGTLIQMGSGTLTLTGSNSHTGGTRIQNGTLALSGAGQLASTGAVNATASGATFDISGLTASGLTIGSLSGSTGSIVTLGSKTLTVGDATSTTFAGGINGTAGLTKQGAGTLTLSGSNGFTGAASINAGTLAFDRVTALNSSSGIGVAAGAILDYTGAAGILSRNVTVSSSGTGTIRNSGGQKLTLSGTLTKDGRVLRLTGGTFDVTGQIVGASANSDLLVDGTSTVTLLSANTYNGPTFVNQASTLVVGINNAIPSNSIVTLGDGTTRGTLDLGSFTNSIGGLIFSGSGGTVRMAANQTASPQLSSTSSLTLGANASLDLTNMQTTAGNYRLISSTGLSGTFGSVSGLNSNYLLRYGSVNANEVSAQRKADQSATSFTMTTGTVTRALVNTNVAVSGSLTNSTASGGTNLTVSLSSGLGGLTVGSLASGTTSIAPQTSTSINGAIQTGTTAGLQNWSVINTDNNAITTVSTATGSITVVNQRTFSVSNSGTISLGNFLRTAAVTGSTTISSSGLNATTANASLLATFSGTNTNGFSLGTLAPTAFNGDTLDQSALYTLSGSAASAGAINGSFSSSVSAEFGSIDPVSVALSGTAYDPATAELASGGSAVGNAWTISLGEFNQGSGTSTPWNFAISNLLVSNLYTADLVLESLSTTLNSNAIFMDLTGTSSFPTLAASGTNPFTAWMSLTNTGTFTNTYNLTFASAKNGQSLGGSQNVTLTVTGVIIVPEPGALALAGIGIAAAAYALRSRSPSRKRAG